MKTKAVLILDDEIDFCLLMTYYLSKKNFTVYHAQTLSAGLEIIETKQPGLIITDKNLSSNFEDALHTAIRAMADTYNPEVWLVGSKRPPSSISELPTEEGDLGDEIKRLVKWIVNKFKR